MSEEVRREVDAYGTVRYINKEGKLHREDGPAIEYSRGHKFWCKEGKRHRLDGPAIEYADGTKFWCKEGEYHRLDGPAVECIDGYKEWWIDGEEYTEEDWREACCPSIETLKEMFKEVQHER